MKLEDKRKQITEYGNVGARPVTSAAASLKNAGDYRQKPKSTALDAKLSRAFDNMEGQKLHIKAGIERSTIPDEIDEIADDYDYDEEHTEYKFNFLPQLVANQRLGNTAPAASVHNSDSLKNQIKNTDVTYLHPEKLSGIHNMDVVGEGDPWWQKASAEDRLDHVKETTWSYKRDNWKERHGDKGREKFDSYFDGLANHIASGENNKEASSYPSVMLKLPSGWQSHEEAYIGDQGDVNSLVTSGEVSEPGAHKYHMMGGNTRSMIHQALGKPIPFKVINPFQSVREGYQINDIRYKIKLLIEKKEEELYVEKKREEWQWKERQWGR